MSDLKVTGVSADSDPPDQVNVWDVTKRYGSVHALDHVSFEVARRETVCLIGPSGSGKSTLLRCIAGLEEPDSGAVLIDGEMVNFRYGTDGRLYKRAPRESAAMRREACMLFQQFNLFPHMSALKNVTIGMTYVLKTDPREATLRATELLERVGLADKLEAYPSMLSGGQQQRVAIARLLAMRPKVMLFDEPTSALDPELIQEVLDVMRDLARDGNTMIVTTHELAFAAQVADRIVFMENGSHVEIGTPEQVLDSPNKPRTANFVQSLRGGK